ncbi:ubiquitin-like protein 7 isoform X1 [Glandiceps talaboti]
MVSLKFPEQPGRFRIEGIDFTKNVDHLRSLVASKLSLSASEFDLIYCGRCMRDKNTLQSYGVTPGVVVHALRKKDPEVGMEAEPMDEAGIQQLLTALHSAIMNPTQRQMVLKILTNRDMLDNVIAATPCLQTDPEALAMLQDPELLIQLADPKMVQKIVKVHPSLGQAALHLAAAVNEESANQRTGGGSHSADSSLFSPDHASIFGSFSDDEMETAEVTPGTSRTASQQAAPTQSITSAQLAAALASAGVGTSQGTASSNPNRSSSSTSSTNQNIITADIFSQAMAQALASTSQSSGQSSGATSSGTPTAATGRSPELQTQLQQLRDMGITDDQRSIRALQATGGDVQAALDLIFEGHM